MWDFEHNSGAFLRIECNWLTYWAMYIKKKKQLILTAVPFVSCCLIKLHVVQWQAVVLFNDALSLHYNWPLTSTPSHCSCGYQFSVDHALSCPTGEFPHNHAGTMRYITASLLSEVCHGVSVKPHLQPLSGETLLYHTVNTEDNARLDVTVNGFWGGSFEKAYIDVRIFNPCTRSNGQPPCSPSTSDMNKKRGAIYKQRV